MDAAGGGGGDDDEVDLTFIIPPNSPAVRADTKVILSSSNWEYPSVHAKAGSVLELATEARYDRFTDMGVGRDGRYTGYTTVRLQFSYWDIWSYDVPGLGVRNAIERTGADPDCFVEARSVFRFTVPNYDVNISPSWSARLAHTDAPGSITLFNPTSEPYLAGNVWIRPDQWSPGMVEPDTDKQYARSGDTRTLAPGAEMKLEAPAVIGDGTPGRKQFGHWVVDDGICDTGDARSSPTYVYRAPDLDEAARTEEGPFEIRPWYTDKRREENEQPQPVTANPTFTG